MFSLGSKMFEMLLRSLVKLFRETSPFDLDSGETIEILQRSSSIIAPSFGMRSATSKR